MEKAPSFTKEDRIEAIAQKTGIDSDTIRSVLNADDDVITEALKAGNRVYNDNVCTMIAVFKPAATKYSPSKKEHIEVPARMAVRFRASKTLKEALN
jgi:nucleoid DNA-binding protein